MDEGRQAGALSGADIATRLASFARWHYESELAERLAPPGGLPDERNRHEALFGGSLECKRVLDTTLLPLPGGAGAAR